jgi:lysophospholipase L1-like esterase
MNDCNYWASDKGLPRVSRLAFSANLREITARVVNFGARCIFLNTNHPTTLDEAPFPNTSITYQQSNQSYNQAVRELSEDLDVVFNDVEQCFLDHVGEEREKLKELLLPSDQLHLSEKGHDLYLSYTYPKLEDAVLELLNDG